VAVDKLLSQLNGVKKTGNGKWISRCPAHKDKSPSLSIRELDDGRVLLHDFAGCSTGDVLNSIGLSFADLMPEKLDKPSRRESRPFTAMDALRCISSEALLIATMACRLASVEAIQKTDKERILLAASRIRGSLDGIGL
jgi:hypothetical protein